MKPLRLLCVLAHPDDESLGVGGTLAWYSAEGVQTFVVTATRGERGRCGGTASRPTPEELGRIREGEARSAAETLGVSDIWFLGRADGRLEREDSSTLIDDISGHIRRVRPQVVITTAPGGFDPHPDHVAVSQLALASIVRAARACPAGSHMVDKLYYIAWTQTMWEAYESAFRPLRLVVDGSVRTATPCPEWAVTARLDTSSVWKTVWKAVQCHRTQIADCAALLFTDEGHRALWGVQRFSRAFSLIPGGRPLETDLFEGLRSPRTGKAGGRGGAGGRGEASGTGEAGETP